MANPTYNTTTSPAATTEAQSVIDIALDAAEPSHLDADGKYAVVVPDGASLQLIDVDKEPTEATPRRTKGTVHLHDTESLVSYINRFGATSLFADEPTRTITGIVNGPTESAQGWGDHRAVLKLRHTPEWQKWAEKSGRLGDQLVLAELIEDRIIDIIEPDGATMLELAQSFEASSSARFKSGQRLASGERQFVYEETVDARAGQKGDLKIPERFTLSLAPFVGESPVTLTARLRFRVNGGDLKIGFVIDRMADVIQEAFETAVEGIRSGLTTGTPIYAGSAPT